MGFPDLIFSATILLIDNGMGKGGYKKVREKK
jgi:hypothetical protein